MLKSLTEEAAADWRLWRCSVWVAAETFTLLLRLGDHYEAVAGGIKIWNEQGQVKYTGATWDYELNKTAFTTLEAKEIATDTLELPVSSFAETGKAGSYAVRYDYPDSKHVAPSLRANVWKDGLAEWTLTKQ